MNPVPAAVKASRLPQVNLLPPEVGQRRARSRQRIIAVLILMVFLVFMAGLGYWIFTLKAQAQERLVDAQARNAELQEEATGYQEVPVVRQLLANITDARAYTGASELNFNDFFGSIEAVLPDVIELDTITISKVGLTSNASESSGPFARPDIGSITFSGTSTEPVDAAELAEALEVIVGIEQVRITTTARALEEGTEEDGGGGGDVIYIVDGTARITIEALSDRFAPEDRGEPIDLTADTDAEPATEPDEGATEDEEDV